MSAVDITTLICQTWFAATGCLEWNETGSAARLSAKHAEEAVAAGDPVARFVVHVIVLILYLCHTIGVVPFDYTVIGLTGEAPQRFQLTAQYS